MTSAETYTEEEFYKKLKRHIDDEEDVYLKIFSAVDIERAFISGQSDISWYVINKIFELNKDYLLYCHNNQIVPSKNGRNIFITNKWDE